MPGMDGAPLGLHNMSIRTHSRSVKHEAVLSS